MLYRVIDASELPALVSAFMESYEVVAPVKTRGDVYVFEAISSPDEIELSYDQTVGLAQEVLPAAGRDAHDLRRARQPA